jgi:hypothetical protein
MSDRNGYVGRALGRVDLGLLGEQGGKPSKLLSSFQIRWKKSNGQGVKNTQRLGLKRQSEFFPQEQTESNPFPGI